MAILYLNEQPSSPNLNLKPENVLLFKDTDTNFYRCKLMDYGFSLKPQFSNTQWGYDNFFSPEQLFENKVVKAKSESWSIGCFLFLMLFGKYAFKVVNKS